MSTVVPCHKVRVCLNSSWNGISHAPNPKLSQFGYVSQKYPLPASWVPNTGSGFCGRLQKIATAPPPADSHLETLVSPVKKQRIVPRVSFWVAFSPNPFLKVSVKAHNGSGWIFINLELFLRRCAYMIDMHMVCYLQPWLPPFPPTTHLPHVPGSSPTELSSKFESYYTGIF